MNMTKEILFNKALLHYLNNILQGFSRDQDDDWKTYICMYITTLAEFGIIFNKGLLQFNQLIRTLIILTRMTTFIKRSSTNQMIRRIMTI